MTRGFFAPYLPCQKLKWGIVEILDESGKGIGHATFAAEETTALIEEKLYA